MAVTPVKENNSQRLEEEDEEEDLWTEARQSRLTIYHSALDLMEPSSSGIEMEFVNTSSATLHLNHESKPVKECQTMFRDGKRTVDFVLVYHEHSRHPEAAARREEFQKNLKEDGLFLEEEVVEKLHFIKVNAPTEVLQRYAEILRLRLPMREVPSEEDPPRLDFDIMTEVKSLFAKFLSCFQLNPKIFPPTMFRFTAEYNRHKSYLFDESSQDFFTSQVRMMVVDFILERTSFQEGSTHPTCIGIHRLISDDVYKAAYPLHDGGCREKGTLRNLLMEEWAQVSHWAMYQPIDQIREYFGVRYALYFAWLGFYTHMLIPAGIGGLFVFLYGLITMSSDTLSNDVCNPGLNITMCPLCDRTCDYWQLSQTCFYAKLTYLFDNNLTVLFAILMSIWASVFQELWKRYSASIVHRWGLGDYSPECEPPRPAYTARLSSLRAARTRRNFLTGAEEVYAPFWTLRLPATLLSFSAVFFLVIIAIGSVAGVVLYRMSVITSVSFVSKSSAWSSTYIPVTAALINLVCIMILNLVYDKVAVYLTEMELLRTQTEFDESLTVKIYAFQFVNYYSSIFYIAFLKGKWVGYPAKYNRIFGLRQEECNPGGCLSELSIQLAIIMVGQQIYSGLVEMFLPWMWKQWNTFRIRTGLKDRSKTDTVLEMVRKQWAEDFKLNDWGPRGLFHEYLEMVMQYGFVTLFVTAFPLAPLFALLNNVFEMRLDAKKFLKYFRRPVPRRAPNIGVWFRILSVLGRFAVISNAFIIAFSSNFIPKLVYSMTVSEDHTDNGFLDHSLATFLTEDFAEGTGPVFPLKNYTECRYSEYREPYYSMTKYKRPAIYWHVLAARLAFIVLFQNFVWLVMITVEWIIPDIPAKLRDQIKREAYLTNEIIIRHETLRARSLNEDGPRKRARTRNEIEDQIEKL